MLAKHLVLSQPFVTQMASGKKAIPVHHMAAIESFTGGAVTRKEMFPTGWHLIWPELAENSEQKTAPTLASQALVATAAQAA